MADVARLTEIERAVQRGLAARHRELRPLLDAYHADQALLRRLLAERLGVDEAAVFRDYALNDAGDALIPVAGGENADGQATDRLAD